MLMRSVAGWECDGGRQEGHSPGGPAWAAVRVAASWSSGPMLAVLVSADSTNVPFLS